MTPSDGYIHGRFIPSGQGYDTISNLSQFKLKPNFLKLEMRGDMSIPTTGKLSFVRARLGYGVSD